MEIWCLWAHWQIKPSQGPTAISLYNLFPSATINGAPAAHFNSGQALEATESIARKILPPGISFEWTGLAYQEKLVGSSAYFIFALAILWCTLLSPDSTKAGLHLSLLFWPFRWRFWEQSRHC